MAVRDHFEKVISYKRLKNENENVKKITFASREGNKPLGIFMDKDSELQSFPII